MYNNIVLNNIFMLYFFFLQKWLSDKGRFLLLMWQSTAFKINKQSQKNSKKFLNKKNIDALEMRLKSSMK